MAQIGGGEFTPQYGVSKSSDTVRVGEFLLDQDPVTNGEFLLFVKSHSEWQPGHVVPILTDHNYLKHWDRSPDRYGPKATDKNHPVTNVSWFAANEYCVARGARLPTVFEWEYVARADEHTPDASSKPEFVERLLAWYGQPAEGGREVGRSEPNYWGVRDMHGSVWEWTSDFNSVFVAGDNRRDSEQLKNLFCGSGSTSSTDRANYAAFMRYALRSSLRANYTTEHLGFRCAKNLSEINESKMH